MSSSLNDVRAAIEERIAAELAKAPTYPIAFQNVPFSPPNNTSWIQIFLQFGDNNYATLIGPSVGFNRHNGVLTVNIFSPVGAGSGSNMVIAERMKDLFDRAKFSGLIFDPVNGPIQINPASPEAYFQTQLTASFQAYLD